MCKYPSGRYTYKQRRVKFDADNLRFREYDEE